MAQTLNLSVITGDDPAARATYLLMVSLIFHLDKQQPGLRETVVGHAIEAAQQAPENPATPGTLELLRLLLVGVDVREALD